MPVIDQSSMTYTTMLEGNSFVAVKTMTSSVGTVSTLISDKNANRKGLIIWNNSSNSCYICFAPTANSANCTYIIPTFQSLTFINPYVGELSVIRNAGTGVCTLWELVSQ